MKKNVLFLKKREIAQKTKTRKKNAEPILGNLISAYQKTITRKKTRSTSRGAPRYFFFSKHRTIFHGFFVFWVHFWYIFGILEFFSIFCTRVIFSWSFCCFWIRNWLREVPKIGSAFFFRVFLSVFNVFSKTLRFSSLF